MYSNEIYDLCCRHQGKRVCITLKDGRKHVGTITKVERNQVWIMPAGGLGGFGLGYGGWGYRRSGFGIGIAIGAIAGVALAGLFFW